MGSLFKYAVIDLFNLNTPLEDSLNNLGKKGFRLVTPDAVDLPAMDRYGETKRHVLILMCEYKDDTSTKIPAKQNQPTNLLPGQLPPGGLTPDSWKK